MRFLFVFALLVPVFAHANQDISLGETFTCLTRPEKGVACWGEGPYSLFLPPKELQDQKVDQVSRGYRHACALSAGKKVFCWGENDGHQLDIPAEVAARRFLQISSGAQHTCGVDEEQEVHCWGDGIYGEERVPLDLGPVREIVVDEFMNCAVTVSGTVRCWGSNEWGQLDVPGDLRNPRGLQSTRYKACAETDDGFRCWPSLPFPDLGPVQSWTVGGDYYCARNENGVHCWDHDLQGNVSNLQKVLPAELGVPLKMKSSGYTSCGIFPGQTVCWQPVWHGFWWNNWGQADMPGTFAHVRKIISGPNVRCALLGGTARCWGDFPTDSPTDVADIPSAIQGKIKDLSAGNNFACAVTDERTVHCWSPYEKKFGELRPPTNLVNPTLIESGDSHSCVLDGGKPRCWGHNLYGQSTPPASLTKVTQLGLGGFHSCALQDDKVTCWGYNKGGETKVPAIKGKIVKLVSSDNHNCVLTDEKKITCWGEAAEKQFKVPSNLGPVKDVSVGYASLCALVTDGLRCWGYGKHDLRSEDFKTATSLWGGSSEHCVINEEKALCVETRESGFFWQALRKPL